MTDFEFSVPVLVVGAGACGTVAALAAHDAGAEVLVIEADARPAGSTAMSQGLICAAGTRAQAEAGVADDAATFLADIMSRTRGLADPVTARTIAEQSGPALDWLTARWGLPWTLDTRFRAAYGNSRLRVHGWAEHGGRDMVELLHARLDEAGVSVLTEAQLSEIFVQDDRVTGAAFTRPDGAVERVGCGALILACGGFAANHKMVARHMPEVAQAKYHGHESNLGDGILLGEKIGGATGDLGSYQGYGMLTDPQGITVPPGVILEGGIIVNVRGERFCDETADISAMVHDVAAQPGEHCWLVFDEGIEARTAHVPETRALIELGAARQADSVEALADRLALPAATLTATLAAARLAQVERRPDAFGRDWGDDRPPSAPFRAWRIVGALYHTQGGLQVDSEARVVRTDGTPFANLYAGGGCARSVSGPSSWGYLPAMGLSTAVTLGWLAGKSAASLVSANSR